MARNENNGGDQFYCVLLNLFKSQDVFPFIRTTPLLGPGTKTTTIRLKSWRVW